MADMANFTALTSHGIVDVALTDATLLPLTWGVDGGTFDFVFPGDAGRWGRFLIVPARHEKVSCRDASGEGAAPPRNYDNSWVAIGLGPCFRGLPIEGVEGGLA